MLTRFIGLVACTLVAAGVFSGSSHAQFYKDKLVTILVNYPAGGPTDIEGRIIARHLSDHIPGAPSVIVKNMGGGGGMTGTNYLGEVAEPDGLTVGFFTWNVLSGMLGDPGLRVKYTDFALIGGIENPVVLYMRKDTPPGINVPADIMKTNGFKALSLSPRSTNTLQNVLSLDILGVEYTPVPGYRGIKNTESAILRGEGQFASTALPAWRASIEPLMGKTGVVIPMWSLMAAGPDGTIARSPAAPEIPTFEEVYESIHGKPPSGIAYDSLRHFIDIYTSMARASFMPPGTPDEAVATIRKAFVALWKDEAFLADYEKVVKARPDFIPGDEGEKILAKLDEIKPEQKDFLNGVIKKLSNW